MICCQEALANPINHKWKGSPLRSHSCVMYFCAITLCVHISVMITDPVGAVSKPRHPLIDGWVDIATAHVTATQEDDANEAAG